MDERKIDLYNKIEKIVEYKNEIDTMQDNIIRLKMQVVKGMADLGLNEITSFTGKATIMDFDRGTLNKDLTKDGLEKATEGENITLDDCKKYTHLSFLLVKRLDKEGDDVNV